MSRIKFEGLVANTLDRGLDDESFDRLKDLGVALDSWRGLKRNSYFKNLGLDDKQGVMKFQEMHKQIVDLTKEILREDSARNIQQVCDCVFRKSIEKGLECSHLSIPTIRNILHRIAFGTNYVKETKEHNHSKLFFKRVYTGLLHEPVDENLLKNKV